MRERFCLFPVPCSLSPVMSVGHYENFPVASVLVPARIRPAVVAVYRFARAADDIADEGDASAGERLSALDAFGQALDAIGRGETPALAPFPELAAAVRGHGLPLAPLHDLLWAFRQDVTTTRYADLPALLGYCARSANPVGRLMLALYGRGGDANERASDAICTGLQLTNFWQDVAVDWAKGRVYLPQDDLARFGVTEAQIAEGRADGNWRALMSHETERARALLDEGRPLLGALPLRLRLEIAGVIAGGRRVLARIDRVGGDVFTRRPVLRTADWLAVAFRALFPARPAPGMP
jgi:squalene synthase HpnC